MSRVSWAATASFVGVAIAAAGYWSMLRPGRPVMGVATTGIAIVCIGAAMALVGACAAVYFATRPKSAG